MLHKLKYKLNRIKFYFKLLVWAKQHSERVKDYKFLYNLKDTCHKNYLEAERKQLTDRMEKSKVQEELINKILNNITI